MAQHHDKLKRDILKTLTFALEKFCFAVHSFVELMKKLPTLDGLYHFLLDKLNQDPLKENFGRQRTCGGTSDDLMLEQFKQSNKKILVTKSESTRVM